MTLGKEIAMRRVFPMLCVAMLAPAVVQANVTALTSASEVSAPAFTFDNLDVGFVGAGENVITKESGFTFPDAGMMGEFISNESAGGRELDVLGARFGFDGVVRFRFEELVSAVGIDFNTSTTLHMIAYDDMGNALNVDGDVTALAGSEGFFGLASDVGIREILIHDNAGTFQLDDLRFRPEVIPIPGSLALAALGMGFVGWLRRRS